MHAVPVAHLSPFFFFFNDTAPTEIYTLSLHDALPILKTRPGGASPRAAAPWSASPGDEAQGDRKSTRLNSSHLVISYAVFCLKKKNKKKGQHTISIYSQDMQPAYCANKYCT